MDVQGIFKNGRYYLTDPACQSLEQLYGNSDLGAMGLIKFLMCHKHNNICQNWKWVPKEISGILKSYNTYRINGKVKYLISPNSIQDLNNVIKLLNDYKKTLCIFN